MRFQRMTCPECGDGPTGTLEQLQAVAYFSEAESDGSVEHGGDTEISWDSQETVRRRGSTVLVCENGHEWSSKEVSESPA